MSYVSSNYDENSSAPMGTWVGTAPYHGECVSYVKAVIPGLPQTALWKKGHAIKNEFTVAKGTLIATFNANDHYYGHAAIYESQTPQGINVVDQWIVPPPQPIHRRLIRFGGHGIANDGDNFFVVE